MKNTAQNSHHFTAESSCPPLKPGVWRLYSMFFCPYSHRAQFILNLKKFDYETVNINLKDKPEWFLQMNPDGKVPVLQKDDTIVSDSMAVCNYLNTVNPDPPIYPSDPKGEATDKNLISVFGSKVATPISKIIYGHHLKDSELVKSVPENVKAGLDIFEDELTERKTLFFFGNRPGMLDYAIFPWFRIIRVFEYQILDFQILSKERFPKLLNYEAAMCKDDVVKSTAPKFNDYVDFFKSLWSSKPNYNIGCEH